MLFRSRHVATILLIGLLGVLSAFAGTPPPSLRVNLPDGSTQDVCLESGQTAVRVVNGETFLEVDALEQDLGCPPADTININSLSLTPASLDFTGTNCTIGTTDGACLFVTWDISVGFNLSDPNCTLEQTVPSGKFSMLPFEIENPSNFVDPGQEDTFVPVITSPGLAWSVNQGAVTPGTKTFRMVCTAVGLPSPAISNTVSVTMTDGTTNPNVAINSFGINQASAVQGTSVTMAWNVSLQDSPTNATCTLASTGVINPVTLNFPPGGSDPVSGQQTVPLLATAPLGSQTFTFTCSPGAAVANDTVNITEPSTCPATVVPDRDSSKTQFWQIYSTTPTIEWPGQIGTTRTLLVQRNRYMALAFNTGTVPSNVLNGEHNWGKPSALPPGSGFAPSIVGISRCEGEVKPVDPNCWGDALGFPQGKIRWHLSTHPNPPSGSCELQPDTDYYLNLIFGQVANPAVTTCGDPSCGHLVNTGGVPQ